MALRCAVVIRGIKKPRLVEVKSTIAEASLEATPTAILPPAATLMFEPLVKLRLPVMVSPALFTGV